MYCVDVHPEGKIAATGGGDDKAFLWNTLDGSLIHEFTPSHTDSITRIQFNNNGNQSPLSTDIDLT